MVAVLMASRRRPHLPESRRRPAFTSPADLPTAGSVVFGRGSPRPAACGARACGRQSREKKDCGWLDDPAVADVQVEVTNREERDAGEGGFGGIKLTPLGEMIIRFHAKFTPHENGAPDKGTPRTDEVDLKGIGPGYWTRAAKDGAERLRKWIADRSAP